MKFKRILLTFVLAFLLIFAFLPSAYAENSGYVISAGESGYVLSQDDRTVADSESLSELLALCAGGEVYFDSVVSEGGISLYSGRYVFSGELTLGADFVICEGVNVSLCSLGLTMGTSSAIRVLGGNLTTESSAIYSSGTAVVLDSSARSGFTQYSGKISSGSACVEVKRGYCILLGGALEARGESCVVNSDTLTIAGSVSLSSGKYDVVTQNPISLSYLGEDFLGYLDIKYTMTFDSGSLTEVCTSASIIHSERISLYDANGKREETRYLDEIGAHGVKNAIAVYKPILISYVSDGKKLLVDEYLYMQTVSRPSLNAECGYVISGYYTDEGLNTPYEFGKRIYESATVFVESELAPPKYILNSFSREYDGVTHSVGFHSLYHPLDGEGIYTYEWLDSNNMVVSRGASVKLRDVSDSGSYKCRFTLTVLNKTVSCETEYVRLEIRKRQIDIPQIPPEYYTGNTITPSVAESSEYTVALPSCKDAGRYTACATLTDGENYAWRGIEGNSAEIIFEILRAENGWIVPLQLESIYEGEELRLYAEARFGTVEFLYSRSLDGEYTSQLPTLTGVYYCKAVVNGCDNYTSLSAEGQTFSIMADKPVQIWIESMPNKVEYFAFDFFDPLGLSLGVEYASGRVGVIDGRDAAISYQQGSSLRYSDSGVIIEYCGLYTLAPVRVERLTYDSPDLPSEITVEYDGRYHTYVNGSIAVVGLDGLPLNIRVVGGGTNAGKYELRVVFETDSRNYIVPPEERITLTVLPKRVDVIWDRCEFIYNGRLQAPSAEFISVFSERIPLSVVGGAIDAGEGYTAEALYDGVNYILTGSVAAFTILRADYDMSGVFWTGGGETYNGEQKRVELVGLPLGVCVLGYTDSVATEAGEYVANASLAYDERNYNKPEIRPYSWAIARAEYDVGAFEFLDTEAEYDGDVHYPTLKGAMPVGKDGSALRYWYSHGAVNVIDGCITVKISFYTDSVNYLTPSEIYRTVQIFPRGETVDWSGLSYTYDGGAKTAVATHQSFTLTVTGGGTNAGTYTVYARSNDENFYPINSSETLVIKKVKNAFLSSPLVGDTFYGREPSPLAKPLYGTAEYLYYTDFELKKPVDMPTECGEYYLVVRVAEGENYEPLTSSPIRFSVIPIVKTGIEVAICLREYFAFEKLSASDFTAYIVNNDGSLIPLSSSSVVIRYDRGESLRAGENTVTFINGEYTFDVKVLAAKAVIGIDSIVWHGLENTYDGTPKYASVSGLAPGVSVLEYVGMGAVNAGSYEVLCLLDYDRENFVLESEISAVMHIKKKLVTPSKLADEIYDGETHTPVVNSDLYYLKESVEYKNAGEYILSLALYDSDNYELADSGRIIYRILPRPVRVEIEDLHRYWLSNGEIEYSVAEGEIRNGEDAGIVCYIEGDRILARADNSNYIADFEPARVIRVSGFAPEDARIILIGFIGAVLVLMLIYIAIRRRGAVLAAVMAYKNRRKPLSAHPDIYPVCPEGAVDANKAEHLLTDSQARMLVRKVPRERKTGYRRAIVNIGDISKNFEANELVDISAMKKKGLVPSDAVFVKVLSGGYIDKPLRIYANRFSLASVKMIVLCGGEVNKTVYTHGCKK